MKEKVSLNYLKKNRLPIIILCVILAAQLIYSIFLCEHLSIMNDEVFSVGLANNTGEYLFFTDKEVGIFSNEAGWFDASLFHDYLSVQKGEQFDYQNVFFKQAHDVHPPLFYLINHTIYSLFPDSTSVFLGHIINIFALLGVSALFYLSMEKLFGRGSKNILPILLFLASGAFVNLVQYLRMYSLLCFFITWMLYLHICIIMEKEVSRKRCIQIALCVLCGGLTHYYFYVGSFFIAAFYVLLEVAMEKDKKLCEKVKEKIGYVASFICGGTVALLIFPAAINHVLHTSVGSEVKQNMKSSSQQIGDFISIFKQNVCNNKGIWLVLLLVISIMLAVTIQIMQKRSKLHNNTLQDSGIKEKKQPDNRYLKTGIMLVMSGICFFFLIAKITIRAGWYYVSPAFIIVTLTITFLVFAIYENKKRWIPTTILGIYLLLQLIAFMPQNIQNVKAAQQNRITYEAMLEQYRGSDVIYVNKEIDCLYGNRLPDMQNMDEVRCVIIDELLETNLQQVLAGRKTTDQQVLFMLRSSDDEEYPVLIKEIEEQTGMTLQELWAERKNHIYLLTK